MDQHTQYIKRRDKKEAKQNMVDMEVSIPETLKLELEEFIKNYNSINDIKLSLTNIIGYCIKTTLKQNPPVLEIIKFNKPEARVQITINKENKIKINKMANNFNITTSRLVTIALEYFIIQTRCKNE